MHSNNGGISIFLLLSLIGGSLCELHWETRVHWARRVSRFTVQRPRHSCLWLCAPYTPCNAKLAPERQALVSLVPGLVNRALHTD